MIVLFQDETIARLAKELEAAKKDLLQKECHISALESYVSCKTQSVIFDICEVSTSLGHSGLCWTVFAWNKDTAVPAEGNIWRLTDTDLCPCGETQTMSRIAESCPLTKLNGGLSRLHSADEDAVSWLTSYGSWNAYEKKKKWYFSFRLMCYLI